MTVPPPAVTIRPFRSEDWPEVRAIFEEGIGTGHATLETAAPSWEEWDAAHSPVPRLVAQRAGGLAGWAALSPVSRRSVYRGVGEVSVYVAGTARGRGVGRALLDALVLASEPAGFWTLQATIIAENEASLSLHRAAGFRLVGRRERIGLLHGRWRDTILLERRSTVVGA